MNKSFLIAVSVIAAAVVGTIVYMSYFAVEATIGKDAGIIGSEEKTQPSAIPATAEERIQALESLNVSANRSQSGDIPPDTAERIKKLEAIANQNTATGPPKNNATPASAAERIKLLESLKNQ